jgi:hypothetical protein
VDSSKSASAFALGYLAETHGAPKLLITYARYRTDESVSRGQYESMMNTKRIANSTFLLGLIGLVVGCLAGPREGYYDGDHHRYYHENAWHDCADRDEHCH